MTNQVSRIIHLLVDTNNLHSSLFQGKSMFPVSDSAEPVEVPSIRNQTAVFRRINTSENACI
jgi:hypothetical protein